MSSSQTTAVVTSDPDLIEEAILGMPISVQRLSATRGAVSIAATGWNDMAILAGGFEFPVHTEGEVAADTAVVSIQLAEGDGSWNGHQFSLDSAWLYGPGSEHDGVGRFAAPGQPLRFATISLPASRLAHQGAGESESGTGYLLARDDRVRELRVLTRDALKLAQAGGLTVDREQRVQHDLVGIVQSLSRDHVGLHLESTAATWITRECIALADSLDPMPSSVELGAALGMSDRRIRAAFRRVFGVSVSAYFRSRAIHGVHTDLQIAEAGSATVSEVAMRWGFWHLGRFSGLYRSFFGELPSETLARQP